MVGALLYAKPPSWDVSAGLAIATWLLVPPASLVIPMRKLYRGRSLTQYQPMRLLESSRVQILTNLSPINRIPYRTQLLSFQD